MEFNCRKKTCYYLMLAKRVGKIKIELSRAKQVENLHFSPSFGKLNQGQIIYFLTRRGQIIYFQHFQGQNIYLKKKVPANPHPLFRIKLLSPYSVYLNQISRVLHL